MTSGITTSRDDLLARLRNSHRLELLALALAFQRGQRAFALLLVEGVVDRQLDALALLVRLDCRVRACRACGALGATAVVLFLIDLGRAADALGSFHVESWRAAALGYRSRAACHLHAAAAQDCTTCADADRRRRYVDVPMRVHGASGACVGAAASLTAGACGDRRSRSCSGGRSRRARRDPASSTRSTSSRWRAAASARARASRSSFERPRGRRARTCRRPGSLGLRRLARGSAFRRRAPRPPPRLPSRRAPRAYASLRFSTTTDFERPWLKFCRTWPLSTVRCSDSGLRAPPRRVLSAVSLVSVMLFSFKLRKSHALLPSGCT